MFIDADHVFKLHTLLNEVGGTFTRVCGGAIRDMLFEKPISDIDVFYAETINIKEEGKQIPFKYEGSTFSVTHTLYRPTLFPVKIQLIKVEDSLLYYPHSFPCNISRVGLTKVGLLGINELMPDYLHKKLRFTPKCPKLYKAKIMAKYHDWEVLTL